MKNCLLCNLNQADQQNSHIVPDFMTKRVFKSEKKKIREIISSPNSTYIIHNKQDTSKEDNILCTECEQYFCTLEREFANKVHNNLWNEFQPSEFEHKKSETTIWREYKVNDKSLFYLFIYSLVFRCHISQSTSFSEFRLKDNDNNLIKSELLKYRKRKRKEIIEITSKIDLTNSIEFQLFIAEEFDKISSNIMTWMKIFNKPRDFLFLLGEYKLYISFDQHFKTQFSNNNQSKSLNIIVLPKYEWRYFYNRDFQILQNTMIMQNPKEKINLYLD